MNPCKMAALLTCDVDPYKQFECENCVDEASWHRRRVWVLCCRTLFAAIIITLSTIALSELQTTSVLPLLDGVSRSSPNNLLSITHSGMDTGIQQIAFRPRLRNYGVGPRLTPRAQQGGTDGQSREENGLDPKFPWRFEGRLWFRPAFVRTPADDAVPGGVRPLGLFGWTIGGVVCLEYDESPVGPYFEYVTMGSLVNKQAAFGQWGSRLQVSTVVAEEVCQRVWNVPAEVARINFEEAPGEALRVNEAPNARSASGESNIRVRGWAQTRTSENGSKPVGGLPVLWTPSIKALWLKLLPLPAAEKQGGLPLHQLRLSASSLRLRLCGQNPSDDLGVPLPVGITVDGLRIEIAREDGTL